MEVFFKYMAPLDIYQLLSHELKVTMNSMEEADILFTKALTKKKPKASHVFVFNECENAMAVDELNGVPQVITSDHLKKLLGETNGICR